MNQDRIVLVVEDDSLLRASMRTIIEDRLPKWQIMEAANGIEGVTLAHRWRPNVILLDYHMPMMNGYEMVLTLKQMETTQNIPLILSSSADRNEPQVAALSDLCMAVIDKSALFQQLAQILVRVVNHPNPQLYNE